MIIHMPYNLFLDDIRVPHKVDWVELPLVDWVIVRDFDQFVTYIKLHGIPKRVTFDHDIHSSQYGAFIDITGHTQSPECTGYDCVKWLVQYCIDHNHDFPEYYLHTMNEVGKQNMQSYINCFAKFKEQDAKQVKQ